MFFFLKGWHPNFSDQGNEKYWQWFHCTHVQQLRNHRRARHCDGGHGRFTVCFLSFCTFISLEFWCTNAFNFFVFLRRDYLNTNGPLNLQTTRLVGQQVSHQSFSLSGFFLQDSTFETLFTILSLFSVYFQVIRGLLALKQAGYIHCDVKPENVLKSL